MPNETFIYVLKEPNTPKVRYLGKSLYPFKRFSGHLSEARSGARNHKSNWIRSLLTEGREPDLEVIDSVPSEEWVFWEREYIYFYTILGCKLVNGTQGGEGSPGRIVSKETRELLSAHFKGKPLAPAHRDKVVAASRMRGWSAEARAKVGLANSLSPHPPMPEETKIKIGNALRGIKRKPFSIEHRAKMSAARHRFLEGRDV